MLKAIFSLVQEVQWQMYIMHFWFNPIQMDVSNTECQVPNYIMDHVQLQMGPLHVGLCVCQTVNRDLY